MIDVEFKFTIDENITDYQKVLKKINKIKGLEVEEVEGTYHEYGIESAFISWVTNVLKGKEINNEK